MTSASSLLLTKTLTTNDPRDRSVLSLLTPHRPSFPAGTLLSPVRPEHLAERRYFDSAGGHMILPSSSFRMGSCPFHPRGAPGATQVVRPLCLLGTHQNDWINQSSDRSARSDHSDQACPCNTGQNGRSSEGGPVGGFTQCIARAAPRRHPGRGQMTLACRRDSVGTHLLGRPASRAQSGPTSWRFRT